MIGLVVNGCAPCRESAPRCRKNALTSLDDAPHLQLATGEVRLVQVTTIGIAAYGLRVRLKRTDEPLYLGAVDGGLYALATQFLGSLQKEHAHDEASQLLQRVVRLESNADTLWGLIESGEYGYAAEGVDYRTLKPSYKRKASDAELIL